MRNATKKKYRHLGDRVIPLAHYLVRRRGVAFRLAVIVGAAGLEGEVWQRRGPTYHRLGSYPVAINRRRQVIAAADLDEYLT